MPIATMNSDGAAATALESKARREMVESAGRLFQILNLPRSTGQIYGLLYFSSEPLSLDGIVQALEISKGSASMGTRQLLSWGAVRHVWVQGDRKDHFEAVGDLAALIRTSYNNHVKPRLNSSEKKLDGITELLSEDWEQGRLSKAEFKLCSERLSALGAVHQKLQGLLPLAEKLL